MKKSKNAKTAKRKMPPVLVAVLYFGAIALFIGMCYGVFRLTASEPEKSKKPQRTMVVEDSSGKQQTIVRGEDAYDDDGFAIDSEGERILDKDGNYSNILAFWAKEFLGAEVDTNDFGVDKEGYCYRPSTGERYKSADGREFTAEDAKNGGFED